MTPHDPPHIDALPFGADGVILRLGLTPDAAVIGAVQALRTMVQAADITGVTEVASSLTSVMLRFDPAVTSRADVVLAAQGIAQGMGGDNPLPAPRRRWRIPVSFGGDHGPQLAEFAALGGMSDATVVQTLIDTPLRVLSIGFAPGLPYVGLLPQAWDVPRKVDLTPTVPRGALVAAVRQLVLFPNPSPTGWRQIGQTAFCGFDVARDPAVLLAPGDEIRFERAAPEVITGLIADNPGGTGGATCQVLQ